MDYQYLLFAHLLGFAIFLLAHGASTFVAASLGRERDPARLRTLLDLSLASLPMVYIGLLLLIGSGIWLGFVGGYWQSGWIWTAIGVLVLMLVLMIAVAAPYFDRLRLAVGLQGKRSSRQVPLGPVASDAELNALLSGPQPRIIMLIGVLGLLAILVLMVLKPF